MKSPTRQTICQFVEDSLKERNIPYEVRTQTPGHLKWSIYKIRNGDVTGSIEVEYEFENDAYDASEFFIVNMYIHQENIWHSWDNESPTNLKDKIDCFIQEMKL